MGRDIFILFQGSTCRLFILIVWLIKSLLANNFALFIIHATGASGLIWWGFFCFTHMDLSVLCLHQPEEMLVETHGPSLCPKKKGWLCRFWPWWMKWVMVGAWTADRPVPPAAPIVPQVFRFGPKQPASPDWHLIRRGLRPNGLIYVNCITNTKRLTLLPSGSVGVKFSKVPGFTEGRCSRPSTPDFRTKKELFPLLRRAVRRWCFNPSYPKRPRSNSSIYI